MRYVVVLIWKIGMAIRSVGVHFSRGSVAGRWMDLPSAYHGFGSTANALSFMGVGFLTVHCLSHLFCFNLEVFCPCDSVNM